MKTEQTLPPERPAHRFDRILQLLVPDKRKRIGGIPLIHPWSIPENHPLLVELIDAGFMTGHVEESVPRVAGLTWMGMDFFNACRHENIRIRLKCRCPEDTPVAQAYAAAVEIHASHGQKRNRYARRDR